MHELLATQGVLETALEHARAAGATRIADVYLVNGALSTISDDSVQFYWETVARGTPAEGARLHFRCAAVEVECLNCGLRFSPSDADLTCPQCRDSRIKIVAGQVFHLEAIDVDTSNSDGSDGG